MENCCTVWGELSSVLCDDQEGWHGGGEREAQEGGDICILTAHSHCFTGETNTTLESNYTPIKKKDEVGYERPYMAYVINVWIFS